MNISQDNYEQYFLDHLEGRLSPESEKELSDFLDANPDLKSILDDFDPSPLPADEIHIGDLKNKLKKKIKNTSRINQSNVDEWLIKEVEGLLDDAEKLELQEFLSLNPAYAFDQGLFRMTRMVPDTGIVFPRKKELKKKAGIVPVLRPLWLLPAAAALILLFIGIRLLWNPAVTDPTPAVNSSQVPAVAKVPDIETPSHRQETPSHETPSAGTPSHETPSAETPSRELAVVSRLEPYRAKSLHNPDLIATEELSLALFEISPVRVSQKKDKPLIAKVFSNMVGQARNGLKDKAKIDRIGNSDLDIWSIARAGINGFNSISDRELELYVRKDQEGKVKSYALLEEDRLILSKNLKKN